MLAEPLRSAGIEVQFASLNAVSVIVTFEGGVILIVVEFAFTLLNVAPLLNVPLNGAVPVKNKEIVDDCPAHNTFGTADTIVPVGRGFTVTVMLPVIFTAAQPLASARVAI